ncbi:MAG: hypothetical protein ABI181_03765 [Mycobacteriaceae bacterium]
MSPPAVDPVGSGRAGLVHVSELLAAHGRPAAAAAGGRRRRVVEPTPVQQAAVQDVPAEDVPVEDAVVPQAAQVEPEPVVEPVPAAEVPSEPDPQPGAGVLGEWAVVVAQLLGALAVGAALWFGFRYLWDQVPVLAAVLATLLTIGLVLGVRGLRGDTDLLSSALAVVAGLVVAFSPPVLALTGG